MCFVVNVFLQIGIALSYGLWAVSRNFTVFVIARIIGGMSKGNVSLSFAVISDVTPPNRRAKAMVIEWHVHTLTVAVNYF